MSNNCEGENLCSQYKRVFLEIWNQISDIEEIAFYGFGDGFVQITKDLDISKNNVVCIIENGIVHSSTFKGIPIASNNNVSKYKFKKVILTGFNSRSQMRQSIYDFDSTIEVIDIYDVLRERGTEYYRPFFEYGEVRNKRSIFIAWNACSSFDTTSTQDMLDDAAWTRCGHNTGNIVVNEYFKQSLVNHEFVESIHEAGHIVALMTNWLRPYGYDYDYSYWYRILEQYRDKPFTMLGLGTQANLDAMNRKEYVRALDPNQIRILHMVAERGEIGVRGYFTADVLREIGIFNVAVIGCPSFFKNGYHQPLITKKPFSYDLKPAFNTLGGGTLRNEASIIRAMRAFKDSKYIIQMERNFIPFWISSKAGAEPTEESIVDFCDLTSTPRNEYKHKMMNMFEVFTNIKKWEEFITSRDFLIGNRIHATILSLKCGVPSIIITPDSRTLEIAELFNIPHVRNDAILDNDLDIKKLYEKIDFCHMEEAYPRLLAGYIEFLAKRDILFNPDTHETYVRGGNIS